LDSVATKARIVQVSNDSNQHAEVLQTQDEKKAATIAQPSVGMAEEITGVKEEITGVKHSIQAAEVNDTRDSKPNNEQKVVGNDELGNTASRAYVVQCSNNNAKTKKPKAKPRSKKGRRAGSEARATPRKVITYTVAAPKTEARAAGNVSHVRTVGNVSVPVRAASNVSVPRAAGGVSVPVRAATLPSAAPSMHTAALSSAAPSMCANAVLVHHSTVAEDLAALQTQLRQVNTEIRKRTVQKSSRKRPQKPRKQKCANKKRKIVKAAPRKETKIIKAAPRKEMKIIKAAPRKKMVRTKKRKIVRRKVLTS
jgi:hypothetical protein